jgi:hypothetical protein
MTRILCWGGQAPGEDGRETPEYAVVMPPLLPTSRSIKHYILVIGHEKR